MPEHHTEWAHPVTQPPGKPTYHWVTFGPGPTTRQEVMAACGKTARFWPRIGIRMDDDYCEDCVTVCAEMWRPVESPT